MKNLSIKDRKRLARLNREIKEMEDIAYNHDGDESWRARDKINERYRQIVLQVRKLTNH